MKICDPAATDDRKTTGQRRSCFGPPSRQSPRRGHRDYTARPSKTPPILLATKPHWTSASRRARWDRYRNRNRAHPARTGSLA